MLTGILNYIRTHYVLTSCLKVHQYSKLKVPGHDEGDVQLTKRQYVHTTTANTVTTITNANTTTSTTKA